jgi:MFS transporter, FHS family, glucose/mannose:H+ symporter
MKTQHPNNASILGVLLISFSGLFLYGFIDNLKGVTLPPILDELSVGYSIGGVVQQGAYFGFLFATLITGLLISYLGHRQVMVLGIICLSIGIFGYSSFSNVYLLLASMIAIGIGLGTLDLVGIRLIIDFCEENKGKYLNLSAFFHGMASMLAPLYAGFILAVGLTWRNVYQFGIIPIFLFILILLFSRLPKLTEINQLKGNLSNQKPSLVREKQIWQYYLLISCYEAVEIGFAVWVGEYLINTRGIKPNTSVLFLSLFFFGLMVGRFLGSLFVERIGYLRMLLIASGGASICLALGILGSDEMILFLPISGFFLSVIFPTSTAAASEEMHGSKDIQLGLFLTFAGVGGIIGSWVIGWLAEKAGMQIGFSLLLFLTLVIMGLVLNRITKIKQSNYSKN